MGSQPSRTGKARFKVHYRRERISGFGSDSR